MINEKFQLKKQLFEKGLIANPDLPLIVYVGRYEREKGLDVLAKMIEKTNPQSAQFVCMGKGKGKPAKCFISSLKSLTNSSHKNSLRFYTTEDEQEQMVLEGISAKKMIRAAADIVVMPSHEEPCGLVAMEAFCSGAFVVTPFAEGFKNFCHPHGKEGKLLSKDANAVCYDDHTSISQAVVALQTALSLYKDMPDIEKNALANRLRNEGLSSHSWYHEENGIVTGAVSSYHTLYQNLIGGQTPAAIQPPKQVPISRQPLAKPLSFWQETLRKMWSFAKVFFSIVIGFWHKVKSLLRK